MCSVSYKIIINSSRCTTGLNSLPTIVCVKSRRISSIFHEHQRLIIDTKKVDGNNDKFGKNLQ